MPRNPTPAELAELETRRREAAEEAALEKLKALRDRAVKWAAGKAQRYGDEAATHGQAGMPVNSQERLKKSWAYHAFAKSLEAGQYLTDSTLDRDPEITQFQELHAHAIRQQATLPLDKFTG